MDRKSIIVLVISFVVLMAWFPLMNHLYPPKPLDTNRVAVATNRLGEDNSLSSPSGPATPPRLPEIGPQSGNFATPRLPEELLTIENGNARYTITSHGGGLKLVELKLYQETVKCGAKNNGTTNNLAMLNASAPAPVLSFLGDETVQGDSVFELSRTPSGIQAEKTHTNGLRLIKEYQLGTNYLLKAAVRFENRSGQPIRVPPSDLVVGTATPMGTNDPPNMMGLYWYDGNKATHIGESWFANRTLGCVPGTPRTKYEIEDRKIVWTAVHNQFFTLLVMPKDPAPGVVAWHIDLPRPNSIANPGNSRRPSNLFGYQTALRYPEIIVAPNQVVAREFEIFAGPKEYNTLARLGNNQDLVMDFGGFFGFFAKALLLSMNALHAFGISYGLAIICITIIIKLLFWPLTQTSTRSMKRMAALQPQMKALQEKYKDDPRKMNAKLMEFMKENKVSPLGGCLPMLIQIPIFFGFYRMLQSAIELRGAPFLWACDLSQPDTIGVIPGLNFPINPLPLIMGATQFWQVHLTPPSPGMDPVQQKIMKYMPLMFLVILYNFSAGLALYWTVQNLLTIVQMKLTKSVDAKTGSQPTPPATPVRTAGAPKRKK